MKSSLLCTQVASCASLTSTIALQSVHSARDGTRKLVFALSGDGASKATVETVLIPMTNK